MLFRSPWLASLHQLLLGWYEGGTSGILGCSALRKSYRDLLLDQIPPANILFILLEVSPQELARRLAARKNHYMNPGLLQSQLDTLEITPDLMRVPADGPPKQIVQQILDKLLVVEGKTEIYTLSYTLSLHDALPISEHPRIPLVPPSYQPSRSW